MLVRGFAPILVLVSVAGFRPGGLPDPVEAEQEFHLMDTDDNGVISRDEAESSSRYPLLPMVFDAVELDGSGALERDEWDRARFYLQALNPGGL